MKKVTDLHKTVKTGMDPRLSCKLKAADRRAIILTRRAKKRPLVKAINVQLNIKFNSWKSYLLKARKR